MNPSRGTRKSRPIQTSPTVSVVRQCGHAKNSSTSSKTRCVRAVDPPSTESAVQIRPVCIERMGLDAIHVQLGTMPSPALWIRCHRSGRWIPSSLRVATGGMAGHRGLEDWHLSARLIGDASQPVCVAHIKRLLPIASRPKSHCTVHLLVSFVTPATKLVEPISYVASS